MGDQKFFAHFFEAGKRLGILAFEPIWKSRICFSPPTVMPSATTAQRSWLNRTSGTNFMIQQAVSIWSIRKVIW